MKSLTTGHFFGDTNRTLLLGGLTLTDTEYTHEKVDWHYHENAYFTFILEGGVVEGNKKEVYECSPGSLLFHHWQDPHYNIKSPRFTRGFHIELSTEWLEMLALSLDRRRFEGSRRLSHPGIRLLFYRIFKESFLAGDMTMELTIQDLLTRVFVHLLDEPERHPLRPRPIWVSRIRDLLHASYLQPWTLHDLAAALDIHPVHLSRDFSKYFHCSLGAYIRQLRIAASLSLFAREDLTLTDISHTCGFSDQSHFVRCFRADQGISPSAYRRLLR